MLAFAPDLLRALGVGDDDRAAREAAAERAAAMALPSVAEEVWRYSRIGELRLEDYTPGVATTTVEGADTLIADADQDLPPAKVHDLFDELNAAFHVAVVIRVPRNHVHPQPVVVTHTLDGEGVAAFPRLVVDAGDNSEVTVIERFTSADGVRALIVPRLFVNARQAARVSYLGVNELGSDTWQLAHQSATGERDSQTLLATVALGGDYARVRTEVAAVGRGATTRQVALYFADGTQMHDFRTTQHHLAAHTNSDLLFKGAVSDAAKSVYTGLIHIGHEARGSVAFQTNRNLTLSAGAWAESVPNLQIETNDVKCSHASTVGPIDEEQRFYLESRGIPPDIAERLVVLGFFDEVIDQLPTGPFTSGLRAQIERKLHGTAT